MKIIFSVVVFVLLASMASAMNPQPLAGGTRTDGLAPPSQSPPPPPPPHHGTKTSPDSEPTAVPPPPQQSSQELPDPNQVKNQRHMKGKSKSSVSGGSSKSTEDTSSSDGASGSHPKKHQQHIVELTDEEQNMSLQQYLNHLLHTKNFTIPNVIEHFKSLNVEVKMLTPKIMFFMYNDNCAIWNIKFVLECRGSVFVLVEHTWQLSQILTERTPEILMPYHQDNGIIVTSDNHAGVTSFASETQKAMHVLQKPDTCEKAQIFAVGKIDGMGARVVFIDRNSPHFSAYEELIQQSPCQFHKLLLQHSEDTNSPLIMIGTIGSLSLNPSVSGFVLESLLVGFAITSLDNLQKDVEVIIIADEQAKASRNSLEKTKHVSLNIPVEIFKKYKESVIEKLLTLHAEVNITSETGVVVHQFECLCKGRGASSFNDSMQNGITSQAIESDIFFLGASTPESKFVPSHRLNEIKMCKTPPCWELENLDAFMHELQEVVMKNTTKEHFFCKYLLKCGIQEIPTEGVMAKVVTTNPTTSCIQECTFKCKTALWYFTSSCTIEHAIRLQNLFGMQAIQEQFPSARVVHTMNTLVQLNPEGTCPILSFKKNMLEFLNHAVTSPESVNINKETLPEKVIIAISKAQNFTAKSTIVAGQPFVMSHIVAMFGSIVQPIPISSELEKILTKLVMDCIKKHPSVPTVSGSAVSDSTVSDSTVSDPAVSVPAIRDDFFNQFIPNTTGHNNRPYHMGFEGLVQNLVLALLKTPF